MLTEKDYCDYDTCVALVDLGMRITSRKVYSDRNTLKHSSRGITYTVRTASAMGWVIAIPLYEAQKWLREEYNFHIEVRLHGIIGYQYEVYTPEGTIAVGREFLTYEEALSEGIKEAVKILKEK
jgi:hypothetical protein